MASSSPSTRPSASRNPPSEDTALPQVQPSPSAEPQEAAQGQRRTSFGFLRRQKSGESRPHGTRSVSGGKMSKKQKALAQEELLRKQREAAQLPKSPPRLPSHSTLPQIETFGGEDPRPDSVAILSNKIGAYQPAANYSRPSVDYKMAPQSKVPVPPVPGASPLNGDFDPYSRTESMTHRGRYSYASSAVSTINSPRRVRRRKDPTPFNILVIGTKGSGKTSFIDFLRTALRLPAKKRPHTPSPPATALHADSPFTSEYLETEVDHERIGVTLWDSQGLEKSVVDLQMREIATFLESKFEDTFAEEQKVVRAPGVRDTHIHCVFLILDPARLDSNLNESRKKQASNNLNSNRFVGVLHEDLDLQVLRTLQGKTTVIPVISKADTITSGHMRHLKKVVWNSLKQAKLDPLEPLHLDDSDSDDDDVLDERDEDAYVQSSSDNEGKSDILNKLLDRSSSDAGHSDASSAYSNPQTSPSSPPSATKRPEHRRKASAMSASIQEKEKDEVPYLPLSIISPDPYEPDIIGRKFPWGFADPYNPEHCDFVRLRESVFSEWRSELREASREQWYEGWRTERLNNNNWNRRATGAARTASANGPSSKRLVVPNGSNGRAISAGNAEPARQYRGPPGY